MNLHSSSVYGPVTSWRYGRSLGIDPIGSISTCSFDCVYCQLGEINRKTRDRAVYVATEKILTDLQQVDWQNSDIVTLSGNGEPTLALNLGEIITTISQLTEKPTLVLTNGTLLNLPEVREALNLASKVSVKLDGTDFDQVRRINRSVENLNWSELIEGMQAFAEQYTGELSMQTMVLSPWNAQTLNRYTEIVSTLTPREIQLNLPLRPKPLVHQLDGRGNHSTDGNRPYRVRKLNCVNAEVVEGIAFTINHITNIPVRLPKLL